MDEIGKKLLKWEKKNQHSSGSSKKSALCESETQMKNDM